MSAVSLPAAASRLIRGPNIPASGLDRLLEPDVERLAVHRTGGLFVAIDCEITFALQIDARHIGRKVMRTGRRRRRRPDFHECPTHISDIAAFSLQLMRLQLRSAAAR